MANGILTQERLKELLHYDPETGIFTRLENSSRSHKNKGCAAGYLQNGYHKINIFGKLYRAHRLAWLYINGSNPIGEIDHIDGNRINNSFSNLRDVSHSVNMQNQRHARSNNSMSVLGIRKSGDKFAARIGFNGKRFHLGIFETKEAAHLAYLNAKRTMHTGNTN